MITHNKADLENHNATKGFTMIELLCVMIIVSSLGVTATGQFLDFRDEGRRAAIQYFLNSMRSALKNQAQQLRLRCGAVITPSMINFDIVPAYVAVAANDIRLDPRCDASEDALISDTDAKFIDGEVMTNPMNGKSAIFSYTFNINYNETVWLYSPGSGWVYDEFRGRFYSISNKSGEYLL